MRVQCTQKALLGRGRKNLNDGAAGADERDVRQSPHALLAGEPRELRAERPS